MMKRRYISPLAVTIALPSAPLLAGSGEQDDRRLRYKNDIYADPYEDVL